MGIRAPFLRQTCAVVVDLMGEAYPALAEQRDRILDEVEAEEAKFARTLEAGTEKLLALIEAAGGNGSIPGDEAFRLHDTFGFPIDLTVEIAAESDLSVDREGFDRAMAEQRERSRGGKGARFVADPSLAALTSEFIGYPNETQANGLTVAGLAGKSQSTQIVLDRSPFYAEGGGQIGDQGELLGPKGKLVVEDTQRVGDATVHVGRWRESSRSASRSRRGSTSGAGGRPPATTPPPTCCIARCATFSASRRSRQAAGWARRACASTSRRRRPPPAHSCARSSAA